MKPILLPLRAGYSLIEILVVLAIIGLISGAAVLTARPAADPVRRSAETMLTDIARAETLAVTRGQFIGLQARTSGYDFLVYQDGIWTRMPTRSGLEGRAFPETVRLVSAAPNRNLSSSGELVPDYWFDPTGANDVAVFDLRSDAQSWSVEVGMLGGPRLVSRGS